MIEVYLSYLQWVLAEIFFASVMNYEQAKSDQSPKYFFGNENYYFIYMHIEQLFIDFEKKITEKQDFFMHEIAMVFVLQFVYGKA